jgi:hypothetical protein
VIGRYSPPNKKSLDKDGREVLASVLVEAEAKGGEELPMGCNKSR